MHQHKSCCDLKVNSWQAECVPSCLALYFFFLYAASPLTVEPELCESHRAARPSPSKPANPGESAVTHHLLSFSIEALKTDRGETGVTTVISSRTMLQIPPQTARRDAGSTSWTLIFLCCSFLCKVKDVQLCRKVLTIFHVSHTWMRNPETITLFFINFIQPE